MKLPVIDKPLFELPWPSQSTKVLARPFLVKEEKILLSAQQSEDDKDIILAIKQILQNCIQDPNFSANKLATFDLEYMFLKLRARSVSNIVDVTYRDYEDEKEYSFSIDLDEVDILKNENFDNKVMVTDEIGVVLQYPLVSAIESMPDGDPTERAEHLIKSCIKSIFDADNVYPAEDYSDEEIGEFLDSIDVASFDKIRTFLQTIPQMYYKIEYTNSMGSERKIELTSLRDFFTWR